VFWCGSSWFVGNAEFSPLDGPFGFTFVGFWVSGDSVLVGICRGAAIWDIGVRLCALAGFWRLKDGKKTGLGVAGTGNLYFVAHFLM
jgi:hypothetical protein